jgi:hypothetical protein
MAQSCKFLDFRIAFRPNCLKKLLDLKDGIPFVNEGGFLRKTRRIMHEVPRYDLVRVENGTTHEYD